MKIIIPVCLVLVILLLSCGKDEPVNFEAFNPEAFAFDLGDMWEVNASVRVKGFMQNKDENTNQFSASIQYAVDLKKPNGDIEPDKFKFTFEPVKEEKFMDLGLDDVQFELDSSYEEGIYTVMFRIKDLISGSETSTTVEVELNK